MSEESALNATLQASASRHRGAFARACALALALLTPAAFAVAAEHRAFASAQEGVDALVRAVEADDQHALHAILGPDSDRLLSSGDEVADANNRERFSRAYAEAHRLDTAGDAQQATLVIGKDEWPLPIPLVKQGASWHFDSRQGASEILARRIGRNELSAMQVCRAIIDAEREYASRDLDADGVQEYSARFASAPGKRDGLYWPNAENEAPSPLGAFLAVAADEGYGHPGPQPLEPYHGYYYRILTRQGDAAPGGAKDYVVQGKLIGGFALLAYPARHGASGVMTFLVSDKGVIYQKNLGDETAQLAAAIKSLDPDSSWKQSAPAE
jgi:hypothetical protein